MRASSARTPATRLFVVFLTLVCLAIAIPLFAYAAGHGKKVAQPKEVKAIEVAQPALQTQRPGRRMMDTSDNDDAAPPRMWDGKNPWEGVNRKPTEHRMRRGRPWTGDVRSLPQTPPEKLERVEREGPELAPSIYPGTYTGEDAGGANDGAPQGPNAPAPPPSSDFDGLDFGNFGAGHPPDTNGDVGPQYYIETINTSIGIYRKSDSTRVAAFTFNTFMSQGNFGNLCDSNNFGDPVVVYDTFEDRWIIT